MISSTLTVDPGRAILTSNYELNLDGRPRLIDGYEAFDGRPSPSDAVYYTLEFDTGSVEIEVEDILTGATGSGEVLVVEVESGTWAGGDAAGYVVLFNVTTGYVDDETLNVSGSPVAVANGTESLGGASNDTLDNIYTLAAIEATRDDIGEVPGSGDILGVWLFGGIGYAFRNNAGGTAAVMFKSSTSGWTACDLGRTIAFTSGGTTEIEEDDTITGATSGATATVKRIIVTSGTWAGGDAAGTLVLYSQTGTFQSENLDVGASSNLATIAGDSTETTLLPNGSYEFYTYNFGGHTGQRRMYGCDGVNKAFEWDGSTYVPITTGMTTDTPSHLVAHKGHLFLSFSGGSLQYSSLPADPTDPVFPYIWSAVTGAGELGIGDECTGMISLPNLLAVFSRNSIRLLYGTTSDDFELYTHSDESGAIAKTVQRIGPGVFLDDRGITTLSATDAYGDFKANAVSKYIDPYIKTVKSLVQSSMRVKSKNQYRLFLSNKSAITMTIEGNEIIGFTRQLYEELPVCCCSAEDSNGDEVLLFGSDDGYVYQMDKGASFNGEPIDATIKLHFNHLNSPSVVKRIRKIVLELDAPINTYLSASVEFDYGAEGNQGETFLTDSQGGLWGVDSWDQFIWDGKSTSSQPLDIDGDGENFSLTIHHSGEWELQGLDGLPYSFPFVFATERSGITGAGSHTIQGYIVHYDMRKIQR